MERIAKIITRIKYHWDDQGINDHGMILRSRGSVDEGGIKISKR